MYYPTTRVLTVLALLQAGERLSGRELAGRLEVSERSVRQYVAQLQDLGVPIESTPGRYGGYQLRPGWTLPPLWLTADEAAALTLGLLAGRASGLTAAAPGAEGALAKLTRSVPPEVRQQVDALQTALVIDGAAPYLAPAGPAVRLLSRAAQRCVGVWLRYRSWGGEVTERIIEPYGVVHYGGRWFAAGRCRLRDDLRVFRLDRVEAAELEGTPFDRPAGFDPLAWVIESLGRTPGPLRVEVLVSAPIREVRSCIPPSAASLEETPRGVLLRGAVKNLDWFAELLVSLRCPLVVREPPELRAALHAFADRVRALAEATEE